MNLTLFAVRQSISRQVCARLISAARVVVVACGVSLVVLCGAADRASTTDNQSQTFVGAAEDTIRLGKNKRLIVESAGERAEYGPGDVVYLRWVDGVVYINDIQILPVPGSGESQTYDVGILKKIYGSVPLILRYVEDHKADGSEEQIWNEAVRYRESLREETTSEMARRYRLLVRGDKARGQAPLHPDSAAALAAQILREKTDLVDSVITGGPPYRSPGDLTGHFSVFWKGMSHESEGLTIYVSESDPEEPLTNVDPRLTSMERYWDYASSLRRSLSREGGNLTIELINGTRAYLGGGAVEEKEVEK